MNRSLNLGSVSGIQIKVHWTFLLLIAWVAILEVIRGGGLNNIFWGILFILVLFGCVVLHELGHALTAKKYDINTEKITLLPIGGVASLESMPENPVEELLVALAGPAVNVVIAFLLYLVVPVESYLSQDPEVLRESLKTIDAGNFFFYLLSANIILVLFNLIPAFPMDGGRVLRAVLSMKLDRVRATQVASMLGRMVAFFLFLFGLFYNPILVLIAIFVYFGAHGENVMVQQLTLLRDHKVKDAMMTDITTLSPDDTLEHVIDVVLAGAERDFVVTSNGNIEGVLFQSDMREAIEKKKTDMQVKEMMHKDFETMVYDEDLTEIYRKIRSTKEQFFPVLKNGQLAGAIDMSNISEFMTFRASLDF